VQKTKHPKSSAVSTQPPSAHLSSGQLSVETGLTRGAIRLYEKQGLIKPDSRTSSGYRVFSADTVITLNAIKVASRAGFTLSEIGDLLSLIDEEHFSPAAVRTALKVKIQAVDEKVEHLNQFKKFMQQVAKKPEMLLDPNCDAMLELAMLAANDPKTSEKRKTK
jgi:MerR family transcriptional regulator, copper efflux regulator